MPLPANRKRNWYSIGNAPWNHSVRLDEDRAEDRAGHGAEPADDDHGEDADALDGSEDRPGRAPAGGARAGRPRTTRRTRRPRMRGASTCAGVSLNACALRSFSRTATMSRITRECARPADREQDREQARDAHEVELPLARDVDVAERCPDREPPDPCRAGCRGGSRTRSREALISVQQERRRRDREGERGDRQHEAADAQRREADDHRRDGADRRRERGSSAIGSRSHRTLTAPAAAAPMATNATWPRLISPAQPVRSTSDIAMIE